MTYDPGFARMMGACEKIADKPDQGGYFIEFSAEADCMLMQGDR